MRWKRPGVRYAASPEPETPYQRAGQVWDERIGSARVQARNWRLTAFGLIGLASLVALDNIRLRSTATITPWIVRVDQVGAATAIGPASDAEPNDREIAYSLARWIEWTRSVSIDPVVLRENWLRAYAFVTDRGAATLNEQARANDPFARVGERAVTVEVQSVIRASPSSFRLAWTECRYERGQLAGAERWSAILTIVHQAPKDADTIARNPLGLYVHGLDWSRELGAAAVPAQCGGPAQ
ncbi:conjugal transfer protein TrbF [Sphingomonas sp. BT-65]|uniref:conjugal transfer protein TrbF n=1 Tax=Sphingomonas sp. BT-65 TaxID=2989821 RepID=UPI0022365063|nr:conjugal transfer protein TrbF [Sphingomonas sp. BT-65]MCW4460817.1 conjugal transfer protein TrbF [Sphingomonas sp. BT-65]